VSQYASGTDVTIGRSIQELEKLVGKHGATGFSYGRDDTEGYTQVVFRLADRLIRFRIDRPDPADFRKTPAGYARDIAGAEKFAADEERRLWRSLVLVVKAMLVAVADGVLDLSEVFLPYTLLPAGQTFSEWAGPQLDTIYATQQMPALLPGAARALPGRVHPEETQHGGE
jgi:hypothetical protein